MHTKKYTLQHNTIPAHRALYTLHNPFTRFPLLLRAQHHAPGLRAEGVHALHGGRHLAGAVLLSAGHHCAECSVQCYIVQVYR